MGWFEIAKKLVVNLGHQPTIAEILLIEEQAKVQARKAETEKNLYFRKILSEARRRK